MLRRKGCTVIEAADGQTGIDQFRGSATKIDVVLLDLTLPGMSGAEVMAELRRIRPAQGRGGRSRASPVLCPYQVRRVPQAKVLSTALAVTAGIILSHAIRKGSLAAAGRRRGNERLTSQGREK